MALHAHIHPWVNRRPVVPALLRRKSHAFDMINKSVVQST
jgi:hypothetical protein